MKTKHEINVVIVESHQHALEHYHSAIRKFKIFEPWSMIHFDAHPDLACPQCPAVACFSPRRHEGANLYELLDLSVTGIAEWILPLVVAAALKRIDWVKPPFSLQFPLGRHVYKIGAAYCSNTEEQTTTSPTLPVINSFLDLSEAAVIKTDFDTPYYHDDDAVVPSSDLILAQTLELVVQELPKSLSVGNEKWALDICLDYFACQNPFLSDIDKVNSAATEALLQLMSNAKKVGNYARSTELKQTVAAILSSENDNTSMNNPLLQYFGSEEADEASAHLNALKRLTDDDSTLKNLVLKAIPNWDMPHDVSSADKEKIKTAICHMEHSLRTCTSAPPFLVSICRSSDDEFTPPWLVEFIQEQVLDLLDRIFCCSPSATHSLRVVKDYGEWEGSTIV